MRYRRLDDNWDYTFGNGLQNFLTEREAVAQAIKSRLLLLYSEWWEDQEDGLPLFQKILANSGSPANIEAVDIIFRDRISGTKDVVSVASYESEFRDRKYYFTAVVNTTYGEIFLSNKEEG